MTDSGKHPLSVELDCAPRGGVQVECAVNGPIETNTYFVVSGGEALVIDPAWEGERLARNFVEAHPDVRIRAIVCTHCHGDHVGGVAGMRRVLGDSVPFAISEVDSAYIESAVERMQRTWGFDIEMPPAPDVLLSEGDVVEVGDARLQVLLTPGHTPGGIVLFCASEQGNVAFVGDTLFPGAHGRTDLEGGSDAQIMRSLAKLGSSLPQDTTCLIGHGPSTTVAAELAGNPFMVRAMKRAR